MTNNHDKIRDQILELELKLIPKNLSIAVKILNIRRGCDCWIADVSLDDVIIKNCEYPDKLFKNLE